MPDFHARIVTGGPLLCFLFVISSAAAQTENSDVFFLGGALHGLGGTTWTAEGGFIYKPTTHFGFGLAYNNDGHLTDNHRDGLSAQGWYIQPLLKGVELQLGTGPYANMNNTTIDGVRENQFKVGLLTSAALKWRVTENGWYVRAQYNNTWVPGSFHSNALLAGIGRDFRYSQDPSEKLIDADLSYWTGWSRTTQIGLQHSAIPYEAEAKVDIGHQWSYSVAFLSEGDTNLANRKGLPAQVWYGADLSCELRIEGGLGPYIAYDTLRAQKMNLLGIGSLRGTFKVYETPAHRYEIGLMYTRVASFYNRDQDIVMAGLLVRSPLSATKVRDCK